MAFKQHRYGAHLVHHLGGKLGICEDIDCIEEKCEKRHPYECKFGIRCRFRKNNECMYLHATLASDDGKFQALKKQFETKLASLENNIAKMEKIQAEKDAAIKSLNGKCEKFEKSLVSIEHLKEHLENKTSIINGLEIKLEELEKFHQKHNKQHEKKLKDLENSVKQRKSKDVIPETEVENKKKCDKCDYTTSSRQGLLLLLLHLPLKR